MKNLRNVLRFLCILTIGLSLTNCQNDSVAEIQQEEALQQEFPFKSSLVTIQDFETNTKLSTQMRSLATLQTSSMESAYNEAYNFTVHTDVANFVESIENNSHSYTFPISRENSTSSALENIVFSYNATTDDYDASLVTYHFTASQLQDFLLTQHVNTPHEITYEPIAVNLSDILGENLLPCTTTYSVYHIIPDALPNAQDTFLYSTNGFIQNECQHEDGDDPCETFTLIDIYCPNSDGGSPSSDDSTQNPYSSPNNTASGGSTTNNDTDVPPNNDTDDAIDNIVTSPISRQQVQELNEQLDQAFGVGNWEFAEEPLEGAPSFNNVDEAEAHLNSMPTNIPASESSSQDLQNGDVMTRFVFPTTDYLNIASLEIEVVSKTENFQTGQEYEVIGINSRLSGITIAKQWEPNSNYSVSTSASNGNFKQIIMTGTIKNGAVIGGFDVFVKQTATITMEINKYNGDEGYSNMTLTF